jgi:hypothetical protein
MVNREGYRPAGNWGQAFAAVAALALSPLAAHADTLATFTWVENSGSGTGAESGTLVLDLPGSVTNPFAVNFSQASQAAAPDLTSLTYTFSNGTMISQTNLTSFEFTNASATVATARGPPI